MGVSAIRSFLSTDDSMIEKQKCFILEGITFIPKHNAFNVNQIYIQTKGMAMGTRFTPSFANLYMGKFEKTYI